MPSYFAGEETSLLALMEEKNTSSRICMINMAQIENKPVVVVKLKEPTKPENPMTADEILKHYCDAIDSGDAARITRLRERVDEWRKRCRLY